MSTLSLDVIRPTEKRKSSEIDHHEIFSTQMSELCMSEEFSDVSFEIQDEKIPGHVNILVTRSKYFRALLFGGVGESKQKLFQLKVPIEAFKALLKYIYSGYLSLSQMREENILDTLNLVNQCGCTELEQSISEYLCEIVSLDNVCAIFDTARVFGLETLLNACHTFMDKNAVNVLVHESFNNLSEEALKDIISRDTLFASELQIFTAVSEWCKHNSNIATESVVSLVRLPLMSLEQLFQIVRISGIFDSDTLLDAINEKTTSCSLPYRKGSLQVENFASEKLGARVTQYDTTSFNLDNGFRHKITNNHDSGIIVEIGSISFINHIKILLLDLYSRSYSYFIDVSVDKTLWERVVDHRPYHCRSWQFLYFPSRAVRYIKLVGTHSSSINEMFEVVLLEAYYKAEVPKMIDGVVAPTKNVATNAMGAIVVPDENTYKSQNLLYCDFINYNDQSGYTYHYIGKGSIMVQLGQPYVIGSMRLLLFDIQNHNLKYSYYIETSINKKDWEMVVDKQKEDCSLWQNLKFEPRAIVFIKIVGTKANVGTDKKPVFACVHFVNVNVHRKY